MLALGLEVVVMGNPRGFEEVLAQARGLVMMDDFAAVNYMLAGVAAKRDGGSESGQGG